MLRKYTALLTALALLAAATLLPASAEVALPDVSTLYKNKDVTETWDEAEAVVIRCDGATAIASAPEGVSVADGLISITAKGTYVLRGDFAGRVEVAVSKEEDVRLVLDGLSVASPEGPALLIRSADKVVLTLADGSVNALAASIALTEGEETYSAALLSRDDLSLNGGGALTIQSGAGRGIDCRNDLILANGTTPPRWPARTRALTWPC